VLHLPDQIRLVVERDVVAQLERATQARRRHGQRQAVARIEAGREPGTSRGDAGARVGVGWRRERHPRPDDQRSRGGAHKLKRSPASTTNAHWSGMPGMSLRFSPPIASLNVSGWSLIASTIASYFTRARNRWTSTPGLYGVK